MTTTARPVSYTEHVLYYQLKDVVIGHRETTDTQTQKSICDATYSEKIFIGCAHIYANANDINYYVHDTGMGVCGTVCIILNAHNGIGITL